MILLEGSEGSQASKSFGNSLGSNSKERILSKISLEISRNFSLVGEEGLDDNSNHKGSK